MFVFIIGIIKPDFIRLLFCSVEVKYSVKTECYDRLLLKGYAIEQYGCSTTLSHLMKNCNLAEIVHKKELTIFIECVHFW